MSAATVNDENLSTGDRRHQESATVHFRVEIILGLRAIEAPQLMKSMTDNYRAERELLIYF